jgi:GNAT superfamily N-acetyltransferase
MTLAVRRANLGDCAAILDAYLDAWRAGYQTLLEPAVLDREARSREQFDWAHAIERSASTVSVAADGDRIVGVGESDDEPVTADALPEVQMLYVRPSAWGSGAAVLLLRAMTDRMGACGHRAARLSVVEPQARARRFYEREGWVQDPGAASDSNGLFRLIYYRRDLEPGV